jgi:DNA-binding HxlR family transcriptional regulator
LDGTRDLVPSGRRALLHRASNRMRGVSAKVLTNCLRKLERNGIIERFTRLTSPPTVWYSLTPVGQELCGALANVVEIAQRLKPPQVTSP